jgi:hypothetical protein
VRPPEIEPDWLDDPQTETHSERERRIRRWLGGQLRQRGCLIPTSVWERLKADGRLDEVLGGSDDRFTMSDLLKDGRFHLADYRAEGRRKRRRNRRRSGRILPAPDELTRQIDLKRWLSAKEIKRTEVLCSEMGRIAQRLTRSDFEFDFAAGKPVVAQYREKFLGGSLLDSGQALRLTDSVGAALFELEFFKKHGIPVVGHRSELTKAWDRKARDSQHGLTPRSEVTFRWGRRSRAVPLGNRVRTIDWTRGPLMPIWRGEERMSLLAQDSILSRLNAVALVLSHACAWRERDAVMFVLTGKLPQVLPVDVGVPKHFTGQSHAIVRLEMTVHPWVSAASLHKIYGRIQRIVVGRRNRPPEISSLEFYEFVSGLRHHGKGFREVLDEWVSAHPRDRKRFPKKDPNSLARFTNQFRDVERQVLRPFGRVRSEEVKA